MDVFHASTSKLTITLLYIGTSNADFKYIIIDNNRPTFYTFAHYFATHDFYRKTYRQTQHN